jgi:hypothetical protein
MKKQNYKEIEEVTHITLNSARVFLCQQKLTFGFFVTKILVDIRCWKYID